MRLLLDAHVSSRRVGHPLRDWGHDVLALDQDAELSRLADDEVLALASELRRVVISHNVRDFAVLARSRAEEQRNHGGIVLVTLPHTAYGTILRRLDALFTARPDQDAWIDRVEFLG